ncbi:hypothetical protein BpHYR1_021077 [Brachionus plicatilis]|uniref:Uncharacterized protein n=1 Tax=Brachionus plicatilis TaxID=10195 RepID=A0A3M7PED7_BRAPC|nr:hypothetical protein BpHYR1_021077 [Brachionus plicatilis]
MDHGHSHSIFLNNHERSRSFSPITYHFLSQIFIILKDRKIVKKQKQEIIILIEVIILRRHTPNVSFFKPELEYCNLPIVASIEGIPIGVSN